MRNYITQDQFASILCISKRTLQNRLSAFPASLPPPIRFPGAKSPVWDQIVIEQWQQSLINGSYEIRLKSNNIIVSTSQTDKKKRGRPTNASKFMEAA